MTVNVREAQQLLASLKASTAQSGPSEEALAGLVSTEGIALRPVGTSAGAASDEEVQCLTAWRNRHVSAFLTEFEATGDRTAAWLVSSVGPDRGRIVFTLRGPDDRIFGLCGLAAADWEAGTIELDGVMRGTSAQPGGMARALAMLLAWADGRLGLPTTLVRVMSDNPRALEFYARLGFVETHRVPLKRVAEPGMVSWVPDPSGSPEARQLVHHRLDAALSSTSRDS